MDSFVFMLQVNAIDLTCKCSGLTTLIWKFGDITCVRINQL